MRTFEQVLLYSACRCVVLFLLGAVGRLTCGGVGVRTEDFQALPLHCRDLREHDMNPTIPGVEEAWQARQAAGARTVPRLLLPPCVCTCGHCPNAMPLHLARLGERRNVFGCLRGGRVFRDGRASIFRDGRASSRMEIDASNPSTSLVSRSERALRVAAPGPNFMPGDWGRIF